LDLHQRRAVSLGELFSSLCVLARIGDGSPCQDFALRGLRVAVDWVAHRWPARSAALFSKNSCTSAKRFLDGAQAETLRRVWRARHRSWQPESRRKFLVEPVHDAWPKRIACLPNSDGHDPGSALTSVPEDISSPA